ncbi:alpha/beta hydrolase [soil metagenome]
MGYAFDPEFAELLPMFPSGTLDDVHEARAGLESVLSMLNADVDTTGVDIDDRVIPGPPGAPDVTVRVYRPTAASTGSGLVYIHGGGFVLGSIDSEHAGAVSFARNVGAVVVSVDYRLAPEDPFPAGLEDCYAALQWLHSEAAELGVETERIGVIGSSAGGGLAAGLALLARDRGGPTLCFQYLGIPELDHRLETTSMTEFIDTPLWNRPSAIASWRHYLSGESTDADGNVSPYASPAVATDLAGLPPAYISTMEFDPLRDEGIQYALALLGAGVSCELHSFPGTFHGSSIVSSAEVSRRAIDETIAVLRRRLG